MRVHGLGTSCDKEGPSVKIPVHVAKPAIVGMYYGKGKPNPDTLLKLLFDEIRHLHASKRQKYGKKRNFSVRVRCFIADAPERIHLKGVAITHFNVVLTRPPSFYIKKIYMFLICVLD